MRLTLVVALFAILALLAPLRAVAWAPPCATDDALAEAAAALLLEGAPLDAGALARAARDAGSDVRVVHALVASLDEETRVRAWLAELAARSDAPLACGHARDATRILLLATARGGALSLPSGGDSSALELSLESGFSAPRLVVLDARGTIYDIAIPLGARLVELPVDGVRPLLVQLVATGPAGPRPVAERSVGGVVAARDSEVTTSTPLVERLRLARLAASVAPLRAHRLLSRAAMEQARAVCASGRVSHLLAPGASPDARFAALGVRARFVGEAVGRAEDLDAAWTALLASPSHRAALLDRRFTDAGTGLATDDHGRACVVVALAAWPRFVPPPSVARAAR